MSDINIKKKAVAFIIAICLFALLVSGLTACGSSPNNGGNDDGQTKYSSASVDIVLAERIGVGKSASISASASAKTSAGKYVTSAKGFTYESGNTEVATVDENGLVTGIAQGDVEITVKHAEFGAENKTKITVVDKVVLDLKTQTGISVFGRVRSKNDGLLLVNAASGFDTVFDGAELTATVSVDIAEKLYVICDGKATFVNIERGDWSVVLAKGLKDGLHTLRAYKTTDETSEISVKGLETANGGAFYTSPAQADIKISFYGDGAVLGDGLDGVTSGYAFTTAQKSGAEIEIMALPNATASVVPSEGQPVKDVWNKYSLGSETNYVPGSPSDFIVIDLGGNDVRAIADGNGTVKDFTDGYKSMLVAMRAANKKADIICCYGMTIESAVLGKYIKRIVKELNNEGDTNVFALDMVRCDGKAVDESGKPNALGQNENAELLAKTIADLTGGNQKPVLDYDTDKQDISVVLLGGQSNMEGNAWHEYLKSDTNYAEYLSGYDGIKMSYVNHEDDASKSPDFQKVRIGYGGARSNPENTFGPDLGMAKTLHDGGYDGKVVFIKFAIGDTSFYPRDDSDRTWRANSGKLYKSLVTYVNACLDELSESYNVSLDAMCWMQGESDTKSQKAVDAYENSVEDFVNALRNEFSQYNSEFMFYDAFIKWPYEWEFNRPSLINDIKEKLAEDNLHYSIIDTISAKLTCDKEPYGNVDLAHFDAASAIKLGQMFAQAYMRDYPLI